MMTDDKLQANNSSDTPQKDTIINKIWEQLKLCYDPEIPINIVDLGFIYEIRVEAAAIPEKYDVYIRMTLTNPGCAMGDFIMEEVKNRVQSLQEINDVKIELVFDPPWDRSMISAGAQLELGIM